MDFKTFSQENRKRCESPKGFGHELNSWSMSDWLAAAVGELGEAANIIKKLNRVRDGIRGNKESEQALWANLRREIADTFIYLDLLTQAAGFDLGEAAIDTFNAKSQEIGYPVVLSDHNREALDGARYCSNCCAMLTNTELEHFGSTLCLACQARAK